MRQINCSVVGTAIGIPTLTIDNGHSYAARFESPSRVIFTIPDTEPPWGASITFGGQSVRYVIPADAGAYEGPVLTYPVQSVALPTIVGDHFELNGNRWVWRMADGFCDHALLFAGNVQQVRDCYKQSQDLDVRGRRIFGMMKNITLFDPRSDYPKFWATLDQLLDIANEFGQPLDYNVLPDSGYLGIDEGWCHAHWSQVCDHLKGKAFISLTNEFNHGGNLVGQPSSYANPGGLASQGSATQDTNPPNPTDGTGTGYQYAEWHAADDPTHFSHEYYIWQGRSTGRVMPCVISEHGRRIQEGAVDFSYIRSLTHASMANGCGLTVHTEDGKFSRVLGPNQAAAVRLSMSLLANGQA